MHAFCGLLCILKCRLGSISLHLHTRRSRLNLRDHQKLERAQRLEENTFMIDIRENRAVGTGILRALIAILVVF
ncbi:hypothetical protein DFJ58DRAFT_792661 [Suillus subalutaceus]|uniref:uncharacterized protein n=1 Tax=Suillus subalutaceus TaxID=48586 RepID=UPI001B861D02|nr:uncharacterized protein DFJ58DRAFT_792661 [Suillus subalutaceus]KAG1851294.1 hypothetical protein DFJ58DRAFT_792661 [Suillus subalutaceus]